MERSTRTALLISTTAAGLAYGWIAAGLFPVEVLFTAAGVFIATFAIAMALPRAWAMPALATAYIAPAAGFAALGRPDYHLTLVWLAAVAGPVLAMSSWKQWHLPMAIRLPAAAWSLVLAVTWPIVVGREIDFSLVAARAMETPNGLRAGPAPYVAAWVVSVAFAQMLGLLWLDLLWSMYGRSRLKEMTREVVVPLIVSASAGAIAGLYQGHVDINWMNPGDWPSLGRAGGLMLDANSFGTSAALFAPLVIVLTWHAPRWRIVGLSVAMLLAAGMWTSGSRTALVVISAGLLGALIVLLRRLGPWQARLIPVGVLMGGAALVLVAAVAPRPAVPTSPLERLLASLPEPTGPAVARFAIELYDRNGYGVAAGRMIGEHPLTGVGVGAFNPLSSDYHFEARGRTIQPDNAQNWWRHQIAELGVIGAAPALLTFSVVLVLLWRGEDDETTGQPGAATMLRALITGMGLASLVGMPTQHPAMWVTCATLLFWLLASTKAPEWLERPHAGQPWAWAACWVVAVLTAGGQLASAQASLRVPVRAERFGFGYEYGLSSPSPSPEGDLRWTASRAVVVAPVENRALELKLWALHPDLAANPVRVRVWQDYGIVLDEQVSSQRPLLVVLPITPGEPFVRLETSVSRTFGDGRGLRIGTRWVSAPNRP